MAPVSPSSDLVRYFGHFVDIGECVFDHGTRADQQSYCILGKVHSTCRLEGLPAQMGSSSPLACCTPHDSFRVSNRGIL
jgi:hypothetical protein